MAKRRRKRILGYWVERISDDRVRIEGAGEMSGDEGFKFLFPDLHAGLEDFIDGKSDRIGFDLCGRVLPRAADEDA